MALRPRRATCLSIPRLSLAIVCSVICIAIADRGVKAQARSGVSGRVTGHVYCGDTNGPARLANVTLQPVPAKKTKAETNAGSENADAEQTASVMTDLSGAFTVEHVTPGLYYVIVELPGYLNATSQFTDEELKHPTPEILESLERSFPRVNVDSAQTAHIEVQLQRGAAVSGNVSYDDGSPAAGVTIQLLHKQRDSKWRADTPGTVRRMLFGSKTDDLGHFRISGLSSGEVVVKCTMRQLSMLIEPRSFMGPPLSVTTSDEQTVDVYSGGVFRDKDAKPTKLTIGADATDVDIVIPLGKLHRVSGIVASIRDGHPLNGGTVELRYADDGAKASDARIGPDGSFRFVLVPEGEYQLAVHGAGDGEFGSRGQWNRVQAYEDSTQAASVQRDVSDIVVQLKLKSDSATNSQ